MMYGDFGLNEEQLAKLRIYAEFLISENKKYNLTAITAPDEIDIKHFFDSLMMSKAWDFSRAGSVLDIGSGAGFPGLPLKILFPHLHLTVVEPTAKKVCFMQEAVRLMEISDVEFINARAEDAILGRRERYDAVTARAVAPLPVLLELSVPFVKTGGYFLAMKGSSYEEELGLSSKALKILSCTLEDVYLYDLPQDMGKRAILKIRKNRTTDPSYPRKYAAIKKKSL